MRGQSGSSQEKVEIRDSRFEIVRDEIVERWREGMVESVSLEKVQQGARVYSGITEHDSDGSVSASCTTLCGFQYCTLVVRGGNGCIPRHSDTTCIVVTFASKKRFGDRNWSVAAFERVGVRFCEKLPEISGLKEWPQRLVLKSATACIILWRSVRAGKTMCSLLVALGQFSAAVYTAKRRAFLCAKGHSRSNTYIFQMPFDVIRTMSSYPYHLTNLVHHQFNH